MCLGKGGTHSLFLKCLSILLASHTSLYKCNHCIALKKETLRKYFVKILQLYYHKDLDCLQACVENMCGLAFPSLTNRGNASILGLTCHLLAGEGRGSLQSFCPKFKFTLLRVSHRLHSFDPASHLRLQNPCNFHTLDCFHCSWQVAVVNLWDSIPADVLLRGESDGWRTVLKDIQLFIMHL